MLERASTAQWLQIGTNIAVVIGLCLVVWELYQARELTRAELASESMRIDIERLVNEMGEEPTRSLLKACSKPDEMTEYDAWVAIADHSLGLAQIRRVKYLDENVLDRDGWKFVARTQLGLIFATRQGRFWWSEVSPRIDPQIANFGNELLKELPEPDCDSVGKAYINSGLDE